MLGSEGSNPLLAYHINPYALTVCRIINDPNICNEHECKQQYSVNSPLILKNGITLTSTERGWIINNSTDILTQSNISGYNLVLEGDNYILQDIEGKDRIETAIDFIKKLITLRDTNT